MVPGGTCRSSKSNENRATGVGGWWLDGGLSPDGQDDYMVLPGAIEDGIAGAAVSSRVYVFGGESLEGTFDTTERYDPATNSWDTMPPLPTARHGLGALALRGRIYVLAGGPTPGGSQSSGNEAFILLRAEGRR
ncbi:MAG: hypothetical protein IH820_07925 [Bacteroidetes bacterium]|nr:hypothetical protein [Bacteroidota bacterium]